MPLPQLDDSITSKVVSDIVSRTGGLELRWCHGAPSGFMVAVEGIDGSGVSTIARLLSAVLRKLVGSRIVYTKEPTESPLGYQLWLIIKNHMPGLKRPDILAHLFAADRLWHLFEADITGTAKGIVGAMANGYIVVVDRYKYSSIAYQSAPLPNGSILPMDYIVRVNELAPPAHIVVYLDVDVGEALRRIIESRSETQLYETKARLERVRENYNKLFDMLRERPEWPSTDYPLWRHYVPRADCIYPNNISVPVVVKIDETGKSVEETLQEAANGVVEAALRLGLLHPVKGKDG